MLYGGIYGYPGDVKNKNGKLRLLYECAPMSMIAEQVCGLCPHMVCSCLEPYTDWHTVGRYLCTAVHVMTCTLQPVVSPDCLHTSAMGSYRMPPNAYIFQ